ncbi:Oidioi.mRNA.OKI2018_I69.XSR.g13921.t1.cds [Oikopleura dioica]|uniref:Oidioi.mRNA.OKI2018_I69.XSR.g13921.t1.cds n=1 Tax=Oikopleura dioica TaxID=34765 RepID=A0ABN7S8E0_OIKDI|nr:Oidioi.mRNA.OKI2018_I69.XSR.g13921.t1.cds [Oikopleura dioica]
MDIREIQRASGIEVPPSMHSTSQSAKRGRVDDDESQAKKSRDDPHNQSPPARGYTPSFRGKNKRGRGRGRGRGAGRGSAFRANRGTQREHGQDNINRPNQPRRLFAGIGIDDGRASSSTNDAERNTKIVRIEDIRHYPENIPMVEELFDERGKFLRKENGHNYIASSAKELLTYEYTMDKMIIFKKVKFHEERFYEDIIANGRFPRTGIMLDMDWIPPSWKNMEYDLHIITSVTVFVMQDTLDKLCIPMKDIKSMIVIKEDGSLVPLNSGALTENKKATVRGIQFYSTVSALKMITLANECLSPVDPFYGCNKIPRMAMFWCSTERKDRLGHSAMVATPNCGKTIIEVLCAVLKRYMYYIRKCGEFYTFHSKSNVINVLPLRTIFDLSLKEMEDEKFSPSYDRFKDWMNLYKPYVFDRRCAAMSVSIERFHHQMTKTVLAMQEYHLGRGNSHWFTMSTDDAFKMKVKDQQEIANVTEGKITIADVGANPDIGMFRPEIAKRKGVFMNDLDRVRDEPRACDSIKHMAGGSVQEVSDELKRVVEQTKDQEEAISNVMLFSHSNNRQALNFMIEMQAINTKHATTVEEKSEKQNLLAKMQIYRKEHKLLFDTDPTLLGTVKRSVGEQIEWGVNTRNANGDKYRVPIAEYLKDGQGDQTTKIATIKTKDPEYKFNIAEFYMQAGSEVAQKYIPPVKEDARVQPMDDDEAPSSVQNISHPLDKCQNDGTSSMGRESKGEDTDLESLLDEDEKKKSLEAAKLTEPKQYLIKQMMKAANVRMSAFTDDDASEVSVFCSAVSPPDVANVAEVVTPNLVQISKIDKGKPVDKEVIENTGSIVSNAKAKWNAISPAEEESSWRNTVAVYRSADEFLEKENLQSYPDPEAFTKAQTLAECARTDLENTIRRYIQSSNKNDINTACRKWQSLIYGLRGSLINRLEKLINCAEGESAASLGLNDPEKLKEWNGFLRANRNFREVLHDPEKLTVLHCCDPDVLSQDMPVPKSLAIYNYVKLAGMEMNIDCTKTCANIVMSQLVALGLIVTSRRTHAAVYNPGELPGQHLLKSKPIFVRVIKVGPDFTHKRWLMAKEFVRTVAIKEYKQELDFTIDDVPDLAMNEPLFQLFINEFWRKVVANNLTLGFRIWMRKHDYLTSCSFRGLTNEDDSNCTDGLPDLPHPPLTITFKQFKNLCEIQRMKNKTHKVNDIIRSGEVPKMPISHDIPSPHVFAKGRGLEGVLPAAENLPKLKRSSKNIIPTEGDLEKAVTEHNEKVVSAADNLTVVCANLGKCSTLDKIKKLVRRHRGAHIFTVAELFIERDMALDRDNWPDGYRILAGQGSTDGKNQCFSLIVIRSNIKVLRTINCLHQNAGALLDVNGIEIYIFSVYNFCNSAFDGYKNKFGVSRDVLYEDLNKMRMMSTDHPAIIAGDFNVQVNNPRCHERSQADKIQAAMDGFERLTNFVTFRRDCKNGRTMESCIDHIYFSPGKIDTNEISCKPADHRTSLGSDGHCGVICEIPIRAPEGKIWKLWKVPDQKEKDECYKIGMKMMLNNIEKLDRMKGDMDEVQLRHEILVQYAQKTRPLVDKIKVTDPYKIVQSKATKEWLQAGFYIENLIKQSKIDEVPRRWWISIVDLWNEIKKMIVKLKCADRRYHLARKCDPEELSLTDSWGLFGREIKTANALSIDGTPNQIAEEFVQLQRNTSPELEGCVGDKDDRLTTLPKVCIERFRVHPCGKLPALVTVYKKSKKATCDVFNINKTCLETLPLIGVLTLVIMPVMLALRNDPAEDNSTCADGAQTMCNCDHHPGGRTSCLENGLILGERKDDNDISVIAGQKAAFADDLAALIIAPNSTEAAVSLTSTISRATKEINEKGLKVAETKTECFFVKIIKLDQRLEMVKAMTKPDYAHDYAVFYPSSGKVKTISQAMIRSEGLIERMNIKHALPTFWGDDAERRNRVINDYKMPGHLMGLCNKYFAAYASHFGNSKAQFRAWMGLSAPVLGEDARRKRIAVQTAWERIASKDKSSWGLTSINLMETSDLLRSDEDRMARRLFGSYSLGGANSQETSAGLDRKLESVAARAIFFEYFLLPGCASIILNDVNGQAGAWTAARMSELALRNRDSILTNPATVEKLNKVLEVANVLNEADIRTTIGERHHLAGIAVSLVNHPSKFEIEALKSEIPRIIAKFSQGDDHEALLNFANNSDVGGAIIELNGNLEKVCFGLGTETMNEARKVVRSSFGATMTMMLNDLALHAISSFCEFCSCKKDQSTTAKAKLQDRVENCSDLLRRFVTIATEVGNKRKSGHSRMDTRAFMEGLMRLDPITIRQRSVYDHFQCIIKSRGFHRLRPRCPAPHIMWRNRAFGSLIHLEFCEALLVLTQLLCKSTGPGSLSIVDRTQRTSCLLFAAIIGQINDIICSMTTALGTQNLTVDFYEMSMTAGKMAEITNLKARDEIVLAGSRTTLMHSGFFTCEIRNMEEREKREISSLMARQERALSALRANAVAQAEFVNTNFEGHTPQLISNFDSDHKQCPMISMVRINETNPGEGIEYTLRESIHAARIRAIINCRKRRGEHIPLPVRVWAHENETTEEEEVEMPQLSLIDDEDVTRSSSMLKGPICRRDSKAGRG